MRRARGFRAGLLTSAAVALAGLWLVPSQASADSCVVTVQLLGGGHLSFTVNVPAGTPLSSISLPVKLGVVGVSESCTPAGSTGTGTGSTGSGSGSSGSGSSGSGTTPVPTTPKGSGSSGSSGAPSPSGSGKRQPPSSRKHPGAGSGKGAGRGTGKGSGKTGGSGSSRSSGSSGGSGSGRSRGKGSGALRGSGGVPSAGNPTFSFSLPGPAPLGVPNFFIDSFRIPPFLLPIYQAAGIEYDVPWQVLAAINEIETDYGRNLSISSAGAVGWMQFLPSTWKRWGVDANGDGIADPYNPVDAIFAAARYLHAAGASKNLAQAIFAYNHASWYVQSVLLRAKLIGGMPDQLIGALTGLVQGHFPVAAAARYADDSVWSGWRRGG